MCGAVLAVKQKTFAGSHCLVTSAALKEMAYTDAYKWTIAYQAISQIQLQVQIGHDMYSNLHPVGGAAASTGQVAM